MLQALIASRAENAQRPRGVGGKPRIQRRLAYGDRFTPSVNRVGKHHSAALERKESREPIFATTIPPRTTSSANSTSWSGARRWGLQLTRELYRDAATEAIIQEMK